MNPVVARSRFYRVARQHGVTEPELVDVILAMRRAEAPDLSREQALLAWAKGVADGADWLSDC